MVGLMVVTRVLASCQPATPTTPEEGQVIKGEVEQPAAPTAPAEEKEVVPAEEGGPQKTTPRRPPQKPGPPSGRTCPAPGPTPQQGTGHQSGPQKAGTTPPSVPRV